ncbi:MAG: DUF4136 domain-containing protein [Steroidobacteraceae bacterium]
MLNRVSLVSVAVLAGTLSACNSTPPVRSDYDSKTNIANYHSYVWEDPQADASPGGQAFKNPINEQRLRDAVQDQLANRGLQLAGDSDVPDSYVTVAVGTRQNADPDDRFPVRIGFGFGTYRPGFGSSVYMSNDDLYNYREGRISIDFYDAATRKPIWHATVEQDLTYMTGANAEKRINALVAAMFAKFPGAAKSSSK